MKTVLFNLIAFSIFLSINVVALCKNSVVLVHGNTATVDSWVETKSELLSRGYSSNQIFTPDWGSKSCAGCNNHNGSEETPVRNAIINALSVSCTGKIDIIGHSMGATLASQQIIKLSVNDDVDTFVGIAGAFRGLRTCGIYPFNVWSSTCGYYGLSLYSPLIGSLYNQPLATKVYSIKSWIDQIVCATGTCLVSGIHSSKISGENNSYTFNYGHFGLQTNTAEFQVDLIQ